MGRTLVAIAVVVFAAAPGEAQEASGRGGLVAPRKTRDELVREWDLNSDGSIDQGEAELAASRMRRERAEMRLNSGIDPITGLPRGESPLFMEPLDGAAAAAQSVPEDEQPDDAKADRRESKPLPGTRVPRPKPPGPDASGAKPPAEGAKSGAQSGIAGTRADADRRRQAVTGGVRAGGLAARAGYGAGATAAPLNAGLPIPPKTRPTTAPAAQPRGGLVPGPRTTTPTPPTRSREMYDPY